MMGMEAVSVTPAPMMAFSPAYALYDDSSAPDESTILNNDGPEAAAALKHPQYPRPTKMNVPPYLRTGATTAHVSIMVFFPYVGADIHVARHEDDPWR